MRKQDRRVVRTRAAVETAVGQLLLRGNAIKIADIVESANVGRSTFYDHFPSVDHAVVRSLERPLSLFADGIVGAVGSDELTPLLAHFWQHRRAARTILWSARGQQASRLLQSLVETRLEAKHGSMALPTPLVAAQLAEGALGILKSWIAAKASATPAQVAAAICAAGPAAAAALAGGD